jgi:hypothetical protein
MAADKIPCFARRNSLFSETNSLFRRAGNSQGNPSNDATFDSLWRSRNRDFAKFPVELSALLRQPIRVVDFDRGFLFRTFLAVSF